MLTALAYTKPGEQSAATALDLPETPPIHKETNNPPRLMLMQNGYGMSCLPRVGKEWSSEDKVRRIKDAGYEGFQLGSRLAEEPDKLELLEKRNFGLKFGIASVPRLSKRFGRVLRQRRRSALNSWSSSPAIPT